jgi:hypothetical protein
LKRDFLVYQRGLPGIEEGTSRYKERDFPVSFGLALRKQEVQEAQDV